MKITKLIGNILAILTFSSVYAQPTESGNMIARSFVERIGRSWESGTTTPGADGRSWKWTTDDYVLGLDEFTMTVNLWLDSRTKSDPRPGYDFEPTSRIATIQNETEAWATAEDWARSGGIVLPSREKAFARHDNGPIYEYVLRFEDTAHGGFPTRAGNLVTITVNSYSGKVTAMMARLGVTYDPPKIAMSASQAENAFQRAAQRVYGKSLENLLVEAPVYLDGGTGELSEVGNRLHQERRSRLGYPIRAEITDPGGRRRHVAGSVDAETGEVLDGGLVKGIFGPATQARAKTVAPEKGSAWPTAVGAVAGGLCILGGLWLIAKRRHPSARIPLVS